MYFKTTMNHSPNTSKAWIPSGRTISVNFQNSTGRRSLMPILIYPTFPLMLKLPRHRRKPLSCSPILEMKI